MSVVGSPIPIPANSEIDEDEVMTDDMSSSPSSSTASSRASSPQTPASSYRSRPSLTISYPMQPSNASSSRLNISFPAQNKSSEPPKQFVAPAHPQSHHLHVLPPRKKTTRALIIDHTIWRLVRTRFAQARCELGMYVKLTSHAWHEETDSERKKNEIGFHALHVGQQHQHGNFGDPPEIDVASSDDEGDEGEDEEENVTPESLYGQNFKPGRSTGKRTKMDVADEEDDEDILANQRRRAASHNKRHAPFLSARADGMQKVLFAVLLQPLTSPPVSFPQADDPTLYPMSISPTSPESLRTMPNRLRLALMLLRIVDDLFGSPKLLSSSSSSSPSSSSPSSANAAESSTSSSTATSLTPSFTPRVPIVDTLPADLETLFQISNQSLSSAATKPTSSFRTLPLPSASGSDVPSGGGFTEDAKPFIFSWNNSSESSSKQAKPAVNEPKPQAESSNPTGLRVRPSLASSPLSQPRVPVPHVSAGGLLNWRLSSPNILDDSHKAAAQSQSSVFRSPKQASGRARELYSLGCSSGPLAATAPGGIGRLSSSITLLSFGPSTKSTQPTPTPPSYYPVEKLKTLCSRHLREKCTICVRNSDARTRIGAGLLSTSGSWFLDRRRRSSKQTGSVLADLISDFMRLSAYIISELQEYVIGDALDSESVGSKSRSSPSPSPSPSEGAERAERDPFNQVDDDQQRHQHHHHHAHVDSSQTSEESMSHKPTRAWYSLLCGLITRAVLEGYVSRGWKGSRYVEILMGMGLGVEGNTTTPPQNSNRVPEDSEPQPKVIDEEDEEYLPEGTPSLIEACHILFEGFGKHSKTSRKEISPPEREYISAMEARITEFLEIPHTCPDLATHLTGLSAKYPAEPVERAALQFCEAISKWRGKPELEMYKVNRKSVVASPSDLWIRKYFQIPVERESSSVSSSTDRGTKRQVSPHRETSPPALKKGKLKDDDHTESGL